MLTATCGEGTRTAVRRCVRADAGALTDTNGQARQRRSHAGARRGIARAAGAQETQLLELRKRGRDRAVQRVRGENPATCLVRPLCSEMRMHRSVPRTQNQHSTRWPHLVFVREGTGHGYSRGCCTRALFVPGRRKVLQPCRSAHTPSMVHVHILESSLATHTHGPVLRRYAHGGGRGTCAVLAHTASRRALSEYARTTARTARRRR